MLACTAIFAGARRSRNKTSGYVSQSGRLIESQPATMAPVQVAQQMVGEVAGIVASAINQQTCGGAEAAVP